MDDLDHSVLIAERDWDDFYEESEECSIQQAQLAGLDDSGLSDTDDEKTSTQEPVVSLQTNSEKPDEEHDTAAQTLSTADDCEVGNPSDKSECLSHKTDLEQTRQTILNDNATRLTSNSGVNDNRTEDQQNNNASDTETVQEHEQVTDKPIAISTFHAASSEGETFTKVMEISATPKQEKERWFVTVNDSPVQQRVYSVTQGQKKRRKKKNSKKTGHRDRVMEGQCPRSSNEKEAEGEKNTKVQKEQHKFRQPPPKCSNLNTFPGNVNEAIIAESSSITVDLSPVKERREEGFKTSSVLNTNCTLAAQLPRIAGESGSNGFSFQLKGAVEFPTENPENNPSASPHSQSSVILTHCSELQAHVLDSFMTQLANDKSPIRDLTNKPESNIDSTIQNQPMANRLNHIHNDPEEKTPSDELHQQQEYSAKSKETSTIQETAVGPSRPVYALSSFWDEMEKLTINDILHLRVANTSTSSEGVYLEESDVELRDRDLLDSKDSRLVDDNADSDYFTHVDDSKPDRSSCEFSTLSDDEELLQIINTSANPSPEPQSIRDQTEHFESNYISELLPEQELELTTSESEAMLMLCPQDGIPLYLYSSTEEQSVYLTHTSDNNPHPFELESIRNTPSPVLSVGSSLDDQCLLSFSEIFATDVDGRGPLTKTSDRCSPIVSFYPSKRLSVPETYDDFFSDFVVGNLFFPSVQDQTVPVPIFSSSRSVVRDLVFPEVEELTEMDTEDDNSPIQVMTRFRNQTERCRSPTETPNIYFFTGQGSHWSSFLSLRRIRFIGKGSAWCQKVSSWIFPKEATKVTSYVSRAQPVSHLFHLGEEALVQQEHVQHSASISNRECLHFSIKQADMCLVCIAFASWVLKSYDPQSTDMWKAALLANVSAISAIQYLRKYVKKEATEDDS